MKKFFAEFCGTLALVLFGCGAAAVAGKTLGTLGVAMAFGLSIVAMAYATGGVSGCHINPAVSLGMLLTKRMGGKEFLLYLTAQFSGAIIGICLLVFVLNESALSVVDSGLGQNGYGEASAVGLSLLGAVAVEVVLTFVFVLAVLGVTAKKRYRRIAGIVIGLTLAFVHIMGIPLTGTSVNPARSLAPALFVGGLALEQVWVFIVSPLAGAALAAFAWQAFGKKKQGKQEPLPESGA